MKGNLRTAKHVDDINLTGTEKEIDAYVKIVEATFGEVKLNNTPIHVLVLDNRSYQMAAFSLIRMNISRQ